MSSQEKDRLGPQANDGVTRRDVLNGVLVGAGALLLGHGRSGLAAAETASSSWTGYGGVGDYAASNGNTEAVISAAHRIRDGEYEKERGGVEEDDDVYDLIIVGSGFAGLSAACTTMREHGTAKRVLVLDNHPMFGGEAKQNEFIVDGHHLWGPQGSSDMLAPSPGAATHGLWTEIGMPSEFDFATAPPDCPAAPLNNFGPMFWDSGKTPTGFYFEGDGRGNGGRWLLDADRDHFARAPLKPELLRDIARMWTLSERPYSGADFDRWLDGMTYRHFLVDVLGLSPDVTKLVDPLLAVGDSGYGSDVISAYCAMHSTLPGVRAFLPPQKTNLYQAREVFSFPGGNTAVLRHMVKKLLPDAISGPASFAAILNGSVNHAALDRRGSWLRMRLSSTVVRVAHEGAPGEAKLAAVVYSRGERLHRVKAKAVVMATGGWVTRRILRDPTPEIAAAYSRFNHGPVLVVNVALRHWRFLHKLGFTSARWFDGFGFFANIRRPMMVGDRSAPFHPDKPVIMTLYVPVLKPGHDIKTQGVLARTELFSRSYADYETQVRQQLTRLFGDAGFDHRRDIAGIILNRWGHAYIAAAPGFLLGGDGPPPLAVIKRGYGRIFFGHSELSGGQNFTAAINEGARAARQAFAVT